MPVINNNLIFKVEVGFIFCLLFLFPVSVQAQSITAEKIFELVNNERAQHNLKTLIINNQLQEVAQQRVNDMAEKNYFAHQSPEGLMPWDIAIQKNYDYQFLGENLATDWQSAEKTVQAWMVSSTHKDNILNPEFQETGVAVANQENHYLIVQIFGKEQMTSSSIDQPAQQEITNIQVIPETQIVQTNAENQADAVFPIIPNSEGEENKSVLGTITTAKPPYQTKTANHNADYLFFFMAISYFPLAIYLHLQLNTAKLRF